jgi:hypothetical protein
MLTTADVRLLLRLVPQAPQVAVLDFRNWAEPTGHAVFVRAWASGGFHLRPLRRGALPPSGQLLDALGGLAPLVLLGEGPLPPDYETVLADLPGARFIRQEADGTLLHEGRMLEELPLPEARTGSTRLLVEGKNAVPLHHVDLPQALFVRPCPILARNAVRVSAEGPFDAFPEPRWFRALGDGPVELTVGIRPGTGGDQWEVKVGGQTAEPVGAPAALAAHKLTDLALVFDRTCPDRDAWSDARRLAMGIAVAARGREARQPPAFNQGIREGLAKALREQPEAEGLQVHLAWFQDGHGEGVASPEELESPEQVAGNEGTHRAQDVGDRLRLCTYNPGLDLWDPLEKALEVVARPLLERQRPGAGALIVGNSPPNLPLEATSPFWRLLHFRGIGTTTRRKNARFTELVKALEARGAPIAYLFLTHDRCSEREVADLNLYQDLQNEVQDCLRHYFKVIAVPADAEGVARGLAEALRYLAAPPGSGVVVEQPERE